MIRLSCWIGVMGCAVGGKVFASDVVVDPVPALSPMKRFVTADVDESGGLSRQEFANAAPKLARYFHLVDLDEDGEASLDEILDAWRKYKDRLKGHLVREEGEGASKKSDCAPEIC